MAEEKVTLRQIAWELQKTRAAAKKLEHLMEPCPDLQDQLAKGIQELHQTLPQVHRGFTRVAELLESLPEAFQEIQQGVKRITAAAQALDRANKALEKEIRIATTPRSVPVRN